MMFHCVTWETTLVRASREVAIQRKIRGGKDQKARTPGNRSPTQQSLLNICAAYYFRNRLIKSADTIKHTI